MCSEIECTFYVVNRYIMEMCRHYKYVLYEISKQEMFHLARASNILVALGKVNNS